MPISGEARRRAAELFRSFQAHGAAPIDADILQPSETLLDLYGETIRARAYVTEDPVQGEMMLRPDFTVPVVQQHMRDGAEPARYTYNGDVFRKQTSDSPRAREFLQVGYEVFDRGDLADCDAEVFARLASVVAHLPLQARIGDIGILTAAITGLTTSPHRRAALLRHLWRPKRFSSLLARFSKPVTLRDFPEPVAKRIGLRSKSEIAARIAILEADAQETPLAGDELAVVTDLLETSETAPRALETLQGLAARMPALEGAVADYGARLDALERLGVDLTKIQFEGSYGRTSLEYYDGFVFGLYSEADPENAPVVTGGRYNALTRILGQGREIPAVGGILRPDLIVAMEAEA